MIIQLNLIYRIPLAPRHQKRIAVVEVGQSVEDGLFPAVVRILEAIGPGAEGVLVPVLIILEHQQLLHIPRFDHLPIRYPDHVYEVCLELVGKNVVTRRHIVVYYFHVADPLYLIPIQIPHFNLAHHLQSAIIQLFDQARAVGDVEEVGDAGVVVAQA